MHKRGKWLLALDLSTPRGIIVLEGPGGTIHADIPGGSRVSMLFPAAAELCSRAGIRPLDLGLIGVSRGPGSFTGIRVAVMAAKVLATFLDLPLVAPDSLMVTAAGMRDAGDAAFAVLDARRGEVYYAIYRLDGAYPVALDGPAVSPPEIAAASLERWREKAGRKIIAAGSGIDAFANVWPRDMRGVSEEMPSPEGLAWLCRLACERGEKSDPMQLLPLYLRRPDARSQRGYSKEGED